MDYIINLNEVNSSDIEIVGGKNASIGEMIQNLSSEGINVPQGFATTVAAYRNFISENKLDKIISQTLQSLKIRNVDALHRASKKIQNAMMRAPFSPEFINEIKKAYAKLDHASVAVRSSATAEDLVTASFAGQQETYLNVKGIHSLLHAIKLVFASLFTSRAISYRYQRGFYHDKISLSVGVQPMVRSDKGSSGVVFTLDTESGFDKVILVTASYGLGEAIVQGSVNPDEFLLHKPMLEANKFAILQRKLGEKAIKMVYTTDKNPKRSIKKASVPLKERSKFCINDHDLHTLARQALLIEKHYGMPMDIEWAKDGVNNKIYILQARPETVKSQKQKEQVIERYVIQEKGNFLVEGQSIGQRIGHGAARIIANAKNATPLKQNEVLVTDMTDPDWEPIMKNAAAIVTNRGGRTCHAAIVARELGIPAIVGCGNATTKIKKGEMITVSCAEGQVGHVYRGKVPYEVSQLVVKEMPALPVQLCINMGNPDKAFATQFLPNAGVGLARLEFIISNMIGIHPSACLHGDKLPNTLKQQILKKTSAYQNPAEFYIEKLREGISMIAAAFYPKQVIFRFSDFKSNEYANLLGGQLFEPDEENPMIGFRGASRYKDKRFLDCFQLECEAFKRVRDKMGLTNAQLMVPFVRTVDELKQVMDLIKQNGLVRGKNDLKIYMMCEIPSNALSADEFLEHVDGFSIGSNDLTQLTLGLDRDSSLVASLFDERNEAIKILLHKAIEACNKAGKYIGICGQGPSDHPDFAEWLMHEGIQSMSLNPDTIVDTWLMLAKKVKDKKNC